MNSNVRYSAKIVSLEDPAVSSINVPSFSDSQRMDFIRESLGSPSEMLSQKLVGILLSSMGGRLMLIFARSSQNGLWKRFMPKVPVEFALIE